MAGGRRRIVRMSEKTDKKLLEVLARVAPGTALRTAIEQILRAGTGALIIIGDTDNVMKIANGGFAIDNPNVVAACGCGSSFQAKDEVDGEPVAAGAGACGSGCG